MAAAGCSIEETPAAAGGQAADALPDTVAVNVVHRVHQDGRLAVEIAASRAESWTDTQTTVLSDARFREFDAAGAVATEGSAATVVYHGGTDDAEASGGVAVRSAAEKGRLAADSLSWTSGQKTLRAPAADVVTIERDDGTSLSGSGFTGDFRTREITFAGPAHGTWVSDDEAP